MSTEIEALRSALEPFKSMFTDAINMMPANYADDRTVGIEGSWGKFHSVTLGDIRRFVAVLSGSPAPSTSPMEIEMTEAQIKHMVDRFLAWKLPKTFSPDGGISFERIAGADGPHPFTNEPSGTNLLCATEATEMVRHMLEGLPGASPAPSTEGLREALMLAEKADRIHCKCQECEDGAQAPEACEHCFPSADDARVARRNVLKALGVKMRDVDRCAPDAARTALAGVTAPCEECGGHGGFESIVGFDAHGPSHQWTPCQPCGGTGSVFSGAAPSKEPPCIQRFSGRGLSPLEASKQAQTDKSEIEPDGRK